MRSRIFALLAAAVGVLAVLAPSSAAAAEDEPPLSATRQPSQFNWANATIDLPWTGAVLKDGTTCPGGRIDFTPSEQNPAYGQATANGMTYHITLREFGNVSGITGLSSPEAIVSIGCGYTSGTSTIAASYEYLFYFKWSGSGNSSKGAFYPKVRDFITSSDSSGSSRYLVQLIDGTGPVDGQPGKVTVRHFLYQVGTHTRTFTWTDEGFVANTPLIRYPEADTAPV
ncbi:hypothetical protein [Cryptosporangium japonicum]|uniref:Uncharacterized protein n=1 Tax=Cryptosporangium japonicum TaxID=80872 RepID=A0ABP3DBI2_9ACTN